MNKMFFSILLVLSVVLATLVGGIAIQTTLLWAAAGGLLLLAMAYQRQRLQASRQAYIRQRSQHYNR